MESNNTQAEDFEGDFELSEEECRAGAERYHSIVDEVINNQIADIAKRLPRVDLGEICMQCRLAAIEATIAAKPELAALFIHLGAELQATKHHGMVMGVVTRPSTAIQHIIALSRSDAQALCSLQG